MKTAVLITARSNSSRLNNKINKKIGKYKAIDILILRSKKINLPVVLATTKNKSDDYLCKYVKKKFRIKIFRGDNKNKLRRWHQCFLFMNIKKALIVDGDDIFFDYELYKNKMNQIGNFDVLSAPKNMITGLFTHILTIKGLEKMRGLFLKNKNLDSEMVEPFMKKAKLKRSYLKIKKIYKKNNIRLTLDYTEDLKLMRELAKKFIPTCKSELLVKYLLKNKKLAKINYFRENHWEKNQKNKIKRSLIQ